MTRVRSRVVPLLSCLSVMAVSDLGCLGGERVPLLRIFNAEKERCEPQRDVSSAESELLLNENEK